MSSQKLIGSHFQNQHEKLPKKCHKTQEETVENLGALLFILTIPLDKYQIKSFENINILIKVKLFCLKNFFLLKKKNCSLKQKKF